MVAKTGGHPDQLSTSTWGLDRFHVQSLEKIYLSEELNSQQKEMVLKTIARKTDLLAKGFMKHGKQDEARKYNDMRRLALENLELLTSVPAS